MATIYNGKSGFNTADMCPPPPYNEKQSESHHYGRPSPDHTNPTAPIPHQDHPDFPFNLPSNAYAYFHNVAIGQSTPADALIAPGGDPRFPVYTQLRSGRTADLSIHRHRPHPPPTNTLVSQYQLNLNMSYTKFRFHRTDGTTASGGGFWKPNMFDGRPFSWPGAADDKFLYGWHYPSVFQEGGRKPWMFARLCRMKDKKTPDETQVVAEVLVWDLKTAVYGKGSYIRVPMREVLSAGGEREGMVGRVDEVVTIALAFAVGKVNIANVRQGRRRRGDGGVNGANMAVIATTSAACC